MATGTTSQLGPLSNLTPATYTGWGQPTRVHRTSAGQSAAYAVTAPVRTTWYNCFDSSQIPAGATINGVEVTFSGSIGTAGPTDFGEGAEIAYRLWNGTSYSSVVLTNYHTGSNDYQNPVLGGASDLHGITWDEVDQASFGFDVELIAITGTPVVVCSRQIPMRVYYTESGGGAGSAFGFTQMNGVDSETIESISGIGSEEISGVDGV
jgi:hypothetical protein|tara:strand:- start:39471 stop:40094 length:624 start_codon:yes stop_codon:yes gene_type:complete